MKVAICCYDGVDAISGPASWFQRIPLALAERGHEVSAQIFWWNQETDGVLFKFCKENSIAFNTHRFSTSESNVRSLLHSLTTDVPDLVISDNVVPALLATPILKRAGIRNVGIIRSDDAFYRGIIDRFAAGSDRDRLDAFVSVSLYLRDEVKLRSKGKCSCFYIPSGTPIPADVAIWRDDPFRVVYCGRLVQEQKRILETVDCLIRVCREVPKAVGLIIGDGPEKEKIEKKISESGVCITVTGRKSPSQVQELLSQSQAMLLLSDFEGAPTAVMEAMATGVVPVCLNIRSGIPELVLHNQTGILVADREDSPVRAIRQLVSDRDFWHRLARTARNHIRQSYSTHACADAWDSVIRMTAGESSVKCIEIPLKFRLARQHRGYKHQDIRQPPKWKKMLSTSRKMVQRFRRLAGGLRRRWVHPTGSDGR